MDLVAGQITADGAIAQHPDAPTPVIRWNG